MSFIGSIHGIERGRLGVIYKLAVLFYILAVVIFSYRDGLTAVAKSAAFILVGLFIFRGIVHGERIFFPIEYRLLFGWLLIAVVSSAISASPGTALARVLTLLQVYPIAFVISNLIIWNGDTRFYWLSIAGAAVLSGVITLLYPAQFTDLDGRTFGTVENANTFAALLAVSFGVILSRMVGKRSVLERVLCLLLAAFFVYLVGRTGSRMGMLASIAAAMTVVICFQLGSRGRILGRTFWLVVFGGVILAGGAFVLTSGEFAERYAALQMSVETGDFRSSGDMSLYGRARLYQKGFEIFLTSPLLGVGLDVFRTAQLEFRTIGNNSHSNYLEILAGTGIAGLLCYFSMYYFWWGRLLKAKSLLSDPTYAVHITTAFALAVILLVMDVAWVSYYEKLTLLVVAGLIAEANLVSRVEAQKRRESQGFRTLGV